jgi:hypothetical protein
MDLNTDGKVTGTTAVTTSQAFYTPAQKLVLSVYGIILWILVQTITRQPRRLKLRVARLQLSCNSY